MTNYENMTEEERMKAYTERKNTGETMEQVDILKQAFAKVGKEYGYDNVTAEFAPWRDFKVKWQRSYRWADFKVSDYLYDAPKEVLTSLAETLFKKIAGQEINGYGDVLSDYVLDPDFVTRTQPTYIRRSKKLTHKTDGEYKDLSESFDRLKALGLVEPVDQLYMTWTGENLSRGIGYCSTLMKVMAISSVFDDDIVPDYVLDFVVYHEYLVMTNGRRQFRHEPEFDVDSMEAKFPDHDLALKWLSKMNLQL